LSSRLLVGKAIEINPEYGKAYYRRGISYLAILRPTDAVPDFKKALNIEPGNRAAREQLTATVKLIRRIEFEKVSCASPYLPTNSGSGLASWLC
jgi:tetratricopeptide (TPR) repeat protein